MEIIYSVTQEMIIQLQPVDADFCCGFCDCNDYPSDTYRIRDAKNKERGNTSDNT